MNPSQFIFLNNNGYSKWFKYIQRVISWPILPILDKKQNITVGPYKGFLVTLFTRLLSSRSVSYIAYVYNNRKMFMDFVCVCIDEHLEV